MSSARRGDMPLDRNQFDRLAGFAPNKFNRQ
jgi:hypothetical protein